MKDRRHKKKRSARKDLKIERINKKKIKNLKKPGREKKMPTKKKEKGNVHCKHTFKLV